MEGDGPLCMDCADLGHLVFLARGDAALTRRAKKASGLSAVVVRFSRALDPQAVTVAVVASVRHRETRYDELLMSGIERAKARALVRPEVDRILDGWRTPVWSPGR